MPKFIVRDLMGQDAAQLVLAGFLQQTGRYVEMAAPGIGSVYFLIVNDSDVNISWTFRLVHGRKQGRPHAITSLCLLRRYSTNVRRLWCGGTVRHRAAAKVRREQNRSRHNCRFAARES